MLVAVGLMVLMMVLFATIFRLATGAMATQKGLTENDQRVRLVVTMLRNDLGSSDLDPVTGTNIRAHRTFKFLVPFAAGETVAPYNTGALAAADPFNDRGGYFLISEGNPDDDTDDYIQFTITVPSTSNDRIFGRAAALLQDAAGNYGTGNNNPSNPPYWSNQPAFDAVFSSPILQAGSSNLAEVSYFLRNGTLYRRVLLIRTPAAPPVGADDHSPTDNAGVALPFSATANAAYVNATTKSLWADFDYSIYYDLTLGPVFHGKGDLTSSAGSLVSTFWLPQVRWGFDNTTNATGATPTYGGGYGLPKEYANGFYIGRYTQAETSDPKFGFPATITNGVAANPMSATNAALNYNTATGRVQYSTGGGNFADFNGPRAGEDILLTNVIAFDIKVWDPAASLGPDGAPGIAGYDDDGNGFQDSPAIPVATPRPYNPAADAPDPNEIGAYGSDDGDWRDIGHPGLKIGTNYFGFYRKPLDPATGNPNPAALNNAYYSNPFGTPPTNRYDTWGPAVDIDGIAGNDNPPFRPTFPGPDGRPGVAGVDDNVDGTIDNAPELGTPGSDDFAPLTAIKITIRFYDVTSNQVRDISGVYRLVWEK
jgi:hypothetical protein